MIAGVHYPSDLEGGKLAATALAARLLANPQLQANLQRAARRYAPTCSYNVGE